MEQKLEAIRASATERISAVQSIDELEAIRVKVLGRKGELTAILRTLGELSPEERSQVGQKSNQVKAALEALLENRKAELLDSRINAVLQKEWLDVTLSSAGSSRPFEPGHLHPLSQIQYEIEDIFTSMGFTVLDGPEVETDYYNFEALNIPAHHPARDMQDTFWTEDGNLLRTHTSAIQVRGMEKLKPPF
nr:phenylalanine--tRNA ligase subunit alpha [Spirochaetota bacterium]